MKFDIYGQSILEVVRENGTWRAFRVGDGRRRLEANLIFPDDMDSEEVMSYIDDMYHELARPGENIRRIDR